MVIARDVEQFRREGFLVVRGLVGPDEAAAIGNAFTELGRDGPVEGLSENHRYASSEGYAPADPLSHWPRMMQPHRRSDQSAGRLARKYMFDGRMEQALNALMGAEPLAVQSMFYFKPPGARGQDLHQDNYYLRVRPGTCVAAWLAIDDADEENGGIVVVPGTADMRIACPEKADADKFFTTEHVAVPPGLKEELVPLKAGDCLFFNGSLIHGSYPNRSANRFRRALIFHYMPVNSIELSKWYSEPLRFDGTQRAIGDATGGGPCGTPQTLTAPH